MALCWLIAQRRRRKFSHKLYYPTFETLCNPYQIFSEENCILQTSFVYWAEIGRAKKRNAASQKVKGGGKSGQASFIVVIFPRPWQSAINANSKYEKADKLYTFPEPHLILCLYVTKKFSSFFNLSAS